LKAYVNRAAIDTHDFASLTRLLQMLASDRSSFAEEDCAQTSMPQLKRSIVYPRFHLTAAQSGSI
jgi:hypothetical protein